MCSEQTYCYLLTAGPGGDDATVCRHGGIGATQSQITSTDRSIVFAIWHLHNPKRKLKTSDQLLKSEFILHIL